MVLFVVENDYWIGMHMNGQEFTMLVNPEDTEYELFNKSIPISKEIPTVDEDGEPLDKS